MTLRPATASDLTAIMAIEHASFPSDAWSEAMMREEVASPHSQYLVLEEAGAIIGYGGVRAPRNARDGDIQTIAIAEASRGHGRGRALLRGLLHAADGRGVREIFLEVRADNPAAHALYVSEGFVDVGRRPRYYQPDDIDAVVMRLDVAAWSAARSEATDAEVLS